MLFNSYSFLFFFFLIVSIYYLIAPKYRWIVLLAASYYFYMAWKANFIILIIISTLVDYYCGIKISESYNNSTRKKFIYISLVTNLGLLFVFKYFNFFTESLYDFLHIIGLGVEPKSFNLILPVGISFYTFQTLSYTIDIYYNRTKPEKHLGIFALFVSFFPQLVAGPIERSSRLIPQLKEHVSLRYENIRNGFMLIMWGLFKKILIADRLAEYVNQVFNHPDQYQGLQNIIAAFFFSIQIYCDFSGYSDIAIGAALVLGIRLMRNFRQPYLATSFKDHWSRWHISLSTWFRDYLYIPLGGNKVVKWRFYYNIFIVFLVSGLWHGANWTFVAWGALHGTFLVLENIAVPYIKNFKTNIGFDHFPKFDRFISRVLIFSLVILFFVVFRANNIVDAWNIINGMFAINIDQLNVQVYSYRIDLYLSFALIGILFVFDIVDNKIGIKSLIYDSSKAVKWLAFVFMLVSIALFGKFNEIDFLYFQF